MKTDTELTPTEATQASRRGIYKILGVSVVLAAAALFLILGVFVN